MENGSLEQLLENLEQPAPSSQLDANVQGGIKQLLALENYQKAESFLAQEGNRLDESTRLQLAAAMQGLKEQVPGFDEAYQSYLEKQVNQPAEPEPDGLEI